MPFALSTARQQLRPYVEEFATRPNSVFFCAEEATQFMAQWDAGVLFDRNKFRSLAGLICRVLDDAGISDRSTRDQIQLLVFLPWQQG